MAWPYDAEDLAAIERLESLYNGDAYNADTNPGGMAVGGHRINFEPALQDVARTGEAIAAAAEAVAADATAAGVSETNAAASAAKLIGSSTTSLAIGTGSKAFTTQADKSFAVGTFLLIVSAANPTVNYMAGQVTAYSGTSLTVNVTVTLGSGTFSDWTIAVAGSPGAQGTTGATGATGATPDVQFSFSTGVTDSDPGNGLIKLNNAAAASATQIFVDDLERNGNSITSWVDAFDDSTNTALRGQIVMVQISDPTKFAVFNVTGAVTAASGYRKVPVAYVAGPGGFTNAAVIAVRFSRTGDKGSDGDGAGDVIGPASATDNHVALFDGITGKLLKGGGALSAVALSGDADDVAFAPAGALVATNVQAALEELDTEKASTGYVTSAINALVAAAPGALDTLDELAAALGDDANFAATTATALGNRLRFDASQSLNAVQKAQLQSNGNLRARPIRVRTITSASSAGDRTLDVGDIGGLIIFSGTADFTVTLTAAATLANGWSMAFRSVGKCVVTLDPNSSEQIDGASTGRVLFKQSGEIICDGSEFFTVGKQSKVLLETQTFSGVSAVDFTSLAPGYNKLVFEAADLALATSAAELTGRFSVDNGSNYRATSGDYIQQYNYGLDNSPTSLYQTTNTSIRYLVQSASTTALYNFALTLQNPSAAQVRHDARFDQFGSFISLGNFIGGYANVEMVGPSASAINAFRFLTSSGNVAGTIKLYGEE